MQYWRFLEKGKGQEPRAAMRSKKGPEGRKCPHERTRFHLEQDSRNIQKIEWGQGNVLMTNQELQRAWRKGFRCFGEIGDGVRKGKYKALEFMVVVDKTRLWAT